MEILNRKARYDYYLFDEYEAGIVLSGTEIKSIRAGKANIKDAYVIIKDNECLIINMHISKYDKGNIFNHEETRSRKLLLHKAEIRKIKKKIDKENYTLIPLKIYFKRGRAKLLISLAKGKKKFDKRESIKNRDIERDNAKQFRDDYK